MSSNNLSGALWRKSSYSNGQANCVEVAVTDRETLVAVRDSKMPEGPSLMLTAQSWWRFINDVEATSGLS